MVRGNLGKKRAIVLLTLASTGFAAWNLIDEYQIIQSWQGVLICLSLWLAVPYLNALIGLLTSRPQRVFDSLAIAVFYAAVFLLYALNGSTSGRPLGASHMHILFAPPYLFMLSLVVLALISLFRGIRKWETARRSNNLYWEWPRFGLKLNISGGPGMHANRGKKTAIVLLTGASTVCAVWNIVEESLTHLNRRWALELLFLWLVIPYLNALIGLLSSKPQRVFNSLAIAVLYTVLYLPYALNGSSAESPPDTAAHMHVLFVPPFAFMLALVVLCFLSLFHRFRAWRASEQPASP